MAEVVYLISAIVVFKARECSFCSHLKEIVELVQNCYITTNSYWYPYDKFANEKNEQSEYKYTVSEAIELAKNNRRKEINLSTF